MFTVNIEGRTVTLEDKTPIVNLIDNPNRRYLAAKVNNRLRELSYEVGFDCNVELVDLLTSDGVKVYETSFRYLLAMAFHNLYPDYQMKISYAISRSLIITVVEPKVTLDSKMLHSLQA